jgi:hypothetical protein
VFSPWATAALFQEKQMKSWVMGVVSLGLMALNVWAGYMQNSTRAFKEWVRRMQNDKQFLKPYRKKTWAKLRWRCAYKLEAPQIDFKYSALEGAQVRLTNSSIIYGTIESIESLNNLSSTPSTN